MHGEYKVPDGKLVVIDLDVDHHRLRHVELSGDFFLLPEDAIWRMMAALEGAPADATEEELSGRVRAAAQGAELVGITPEGVAVAVRRALAGETA
ncbi:MAG TPA: biotin--protein ligase [Chloroflexota bacterium]